MAKLTAQRAFGFEDAGPVIVVRRSRGAVKLRRLSPWRQAEIWEALRKWRPSIPNDRELSVEERNGRNVIAIERMPETVDECRAAGLGTAVPCPFVRCRHHLSLEVTQAGSLRVFFPHWEEMVPDSAPTCSLVEAAKGTHTVAAVAAVFGASPRRIAEIEARALAKMRRAMDEERKK
jgi:hypothetical protein